jgi:hypothetical protein
MEEPEEEKEEKPSVEVAAEEKPEKPKRRPLVTTRLSMTDQARLEEICKLEGKTQTEIVRQAIIEMLDRQEQGIAGEIKDKLAERLKKMEDRMAGLIARTNLDVGTIYQVMWIRSDPEKREALWNTARRYSAERASKKLKGTELAVKEMTVEEIHG